MNAPATVPLRTVGEWVLTSKRSYDSPFADVLVEAEFRSPSGRLSTMPGFYDGDGTWRVRFNPGEVGSWSYRIRARPANDELAAEGSFTVTSRQARGFLRATPGKAWGFHYESGEPLFILGDTMYDIFGMDFCGGPVEAFLRRRVAQGFNLGRARLTVSPFHPPDGHSEWLDRPTWLWGGSPTAPRFDLFNLDWFHSVDRTVRLIEELGFGLEFIFEGWGFEFPFRDRGVFTREWEEIYLRYAIARYDAFNCIYFYTPLNEYEYYPNGDWHHKPTADRYAMRIARWIKETAPHGHIVSMHNGPWLPRFADRFKADPEAVDAIMFQYWGTRGRDDGWLAAGIDEQIADSLAGWRGSAVFAEYGYERNPAFKLKIPHHEFCDRDHTRRGAWRGAFQGLGIIHGFENSWGPWMELDRDMPRSGLPDLQQLKRFFTEIVSFETMRPARELVAGNDAPVGCRPAALASDDGKSAAIYLPTGGSVTVARSINDGRKAEWFDPRAGSMQAASPAPNGAFTAPGGESAPGRPFDWVLLIRSG